MSYFTQARNVELSLLDYLKSNLDSDWPGTTIEKTFKRVYAKDVNLPIVCVRLSDTNSTRKEVGATTLEDRYLLIIDIFATSDGQRLDMSYYIKDKLKEGWTHNDYSHSSGNNEVLTATSNGRDFITDWIGDVKIDFGENVDTKDKFRQTISIRVRKST